MMNESVKLLGAHDIAKYCIRQYEMATSDLDDTNFDALEHVLVSFVEGKIPYKQAYLASEKYAKSYIPFISMYNINNYIVPNTLNKSNKGKNHCNKWDLELDNALLCSILHLGLESWSDISRYARIAKTPTQCFQRWNRYLSPYISKTKWTSEEDRKLLNCVNAYGKSWLVVAREMQNRSDAQCRSRYLTLLKNQGLVDTAMNYKSENVSNKQSDLTKTSHANATNECCTSHAICPVNQPSCGDSKPADRIMKVDMPETHILNNVPYRGFDMGTAEPIPLDNFLTMLVNK